MLWLRLPAWRGSQLLPLLLLAPRDAWAAAAAGAASGAGAVSVTKLGLFFLKIGAILYGSGYVLIAFLQGGLVDDLGWLTQQQLLDAVAAGQFTPGPVLTTATFVGYVLGGAPGAAAATLGIFLPSFAFVTILNPVVPKLRKSEWTAAFLDAVNAAAVALMAAVTLELARTTLTSWQTGVIAVAAGVAALRFGLNAVWLVLGGALAGWVLL
jgi:chromate transporter